MKITDTIRRAGRSLKQAKIRTLLTALAIAVGAFTLTLALAAGAGARKYADTLISSNVSANSLAVAKDKDFFSPGQGGGVKEYNSSVGSFQGVTLSRMTEKDVVKISNIPGVKSVQPVYEVSASYVTRVGQKKYVVNAQMYDPTVSLELSAGSLPSAGKQIKATAIIMPDAFVKPLGFKNAKNAIGKELVLHVDKKGGVSQSQIEQIIQSQGIDGLKKAQTNQGKDFIFKIAAVSTKSASAFQGSSAFNISDVRAREISEFSTKGTSDFQKYSLVSVQAKDGSDPEIVKQKIESLGYTAKTAKDLQNLLFTIVNVLQGIVAGFGVLALIASVFGIINTQYISVLERTQQIGLMKALGMRKRDVGRLFRFEAAWIGFLGGVIGAGLAWGLGTAVNPSITKGLGLASGTQLLIFQLLPTVGLVIGLMLVAVLAGILPARKAAKLDPVEALRTE